MEKAGRKTVFTVRFNEKIPNHAKAIAVLNKLGRNKAQFLADLIANSDTSSVMADAPSDPVEGSVAMMYNGQKEKTAPAQADEGKKERSKPFFAKSKVPEEKEQEVKPDDAVMEDLSKYDEFEDYAYNGLYED